MHTVIRNNTTHLFCEGECCFCHGCITHQVSTGHLKSMNKVYDEKCYIQVCHTPSVVSYQIVFVALVVCCVVCAH